MKIERAPQNLTKEELDLEVEEAARQGISPARYLSQRLGIPFGDAHKSACLGKILLLRNKEL